jgi:hypothetical protein
MVLSLSANIVKAQNGYILSKSIGLNFKEIKQKDSLVNFEIYQNGIFIDQKFGNAKNSQNFKFDSLTNTYIFNYSQIGIGSGNEKNYLTCPNLIIKLSFIKNIRTYNDKLESLIYHRLITIALLVSQKTEQRNISVTNIDLNPLVSDFFKIILIERDNEYKLINQSDFEKPIVPSELVKIF